MEQKCVFCGILAKQIPAKVVYEDKNCLAFLDINPRSKGMTLVVPKKHYQEFDEDIELSAEAFKSAQTVGRMIKQSLRPLTVDFSVIPSKEVPHFHIRVYPVYEKEIPLIENQPIKTSESELNETVEKIKSIKIAEPVKEVIEEKPEPVKEKERDPEEVAWIKRELERD